MFLKKFHPLQILGLAAICIAIAAGAYVMLQNKKAPPGLDSMDLSSATNDIINTQRPEFTLTDMSGVSRTISEWDGKFVLINFWATWCQPCLREIPVLVKLQDKYQKQGMQFVGIAIDELEAINKFINDTGIKFNYPVLQGSDNATSVAIDYGNRLGILPYTVIIDQQGTINHVEFGEVDEHELENRINALIGHPS